MKDGVWLSEAIDITDLKYNLINLIDAPAGCGKSWFATNVLPY